MERQTRTPLHARAAAAFAEPAFLRKLGMEQSASALFSGADWRRLLRGITPIRGRISCAGALEVFRPLLDQVAPEPPEGWLAYSYQAARALLFPARRGAHLRPVGRCPVLSPVSPGPAGRGAGRCALRLRLDFDFCTEEELLHSAAAGGIPSVPPPVP